MLPDESTWASLIPPLWELPNATYDPSEDDQACAGGGEGSVARTKRAATRPMTTLIRNHLVPERNLMGTIA